MPPLSQITTVVFDLGGVLIDWNPRYLYRKVFQGDEDRVSWFLNTICTMDWNEQQDAGRPFAEAVALLTAQFPEYADEIAAYHLRWVEMLGGPLDETVAVLGELDDRQTPLYALTNWSAETFPHTHQYPFMHRFRGVVVSGREGLKKPDPKIYRILLDRYQLTPAHTVYIDDSLRNVDAATSLGFHALHFTHATDLRRDLALLGLLE